MDEMVLIVQKWVNLKYQDYPGYDKIEENGKTGWSTVYALTKGLQAELGITSLANNFGPGTEAAYKEWGEMEIGKVPDNDKGQNIVLILQGAMFCTGYGPIEFNGKFDEATKTAVQNLQNDAGLPVQDGKVYDYVFKAFLTMNAYVRTSGGDERVREIQRDLNNKYFKTSGVQPCDGHYQRNTNKALLYGVQTEEDIPASEQTGAIGPATIKGLPVLDIGSSGNFVKLFQYALYFNGFDSGEFDRVYGSGIKSTTAKFQRFVGLDDDGSAGKQTWLSALVSTGDPDRKGTACDCITEVTPERASTLKSEGYKIVGRYLANVDGGINKKLQFGELQTIFKAGLSVFPIYQLNGGSAKDFSFEKGVSAYRGAFKAAQDYGFKEGTTIYFAVDFDVLGHEIDNNIIPYFRGVYQQKLDSGSFYKIGIYGPRNACIQVSNLDLASTSFVSGMSTGFSANLGYPLPDNWAFDQISTVSLGSGDGFIEVDNNINSEKDLGASSVEKLTDVNDDFYKQLDDIWGFSNEYSKEENKGETANYLTTTYYRKDKYNDIRWEKISGEIDKNYVAFIDYNVGFDSFIELTDPVNKTKLDIQHLMATLSSIQYADFIALNNIVKDFSGWAGDLMTVIINVYEKRDSYTGTIEERTYNAAYDYIGHINAGYFGLDDLLSDIDALNISKLIGENDSTSLPLAFQDYYKFEAANRFTSFLNSRFSGKESQLREDAKYVLVSKSLQAVAMRELLKKGGEGAIPDFTYDEGVIVANAFTDKIMYYVNKES